MREQEVRDLVREALVEFLGPRRRRALVLFTGGLIGFDDAIEELRALRSAGAELDFVQTPSAQRILDQHKIASVGMQEVQNKFVEAHDMLIAPTLTANIAAKAAHGIADCLASNLFGEFIMGNRLVVASHSACGPDGAEKKSWFPHMPEAYASMLRGNLDTMVSFGVRLSSSRTLARTALAAWQRVEEAQRAPFVAAFGMSPAQILARLNGESSAAGSGAPSIASTTGTAVVRCGQGLISQSVIARLNPGCELRVGSRAQITAMARDLAANRSIRIVREA